MIKIFNFNISEWRLFVLWGDITVFCLSVILVLDIQGRLGRITGFFWPQDLVLFALIGLTYILVLYIANLYDQFQDYRFRINLSRVILSSLLGTLAVAFLFYYLTGPYVTRSFLEWQGLCFTWMMVLWRFTFSSLALPNLLRRKVLIVGAGQSGRRILNTIRQNRNCGLTVVGFVDDDPKKTGTTVDGLPVFGDSSHIQDVVAQHKIGVIVVAITHEKTSALLNTLTMLAFSNVQLIDMPSLYEFLTGKVPTDHISDIWLFLNTLNKSNLFYRHLKQLMDLFLAGVGLVVALPLLLTISLAIKVDSPGPVFFRQRRLGKDGKPFLIIKFRTMFVNANDAGPRWATKGDPRITRVGQVLRTLHLDELPQLINILRGEMSLIGPRAEWDVFALDSKEPVPLYREGRRAADPPGTMVLCGYRDRLSYYSFRLVVKPGITGWAQVMFPQAGSSFQDLKEKLQYDLYYIKNVSLLFDLAILLKTIRIVLFGHGK